MTKQRPPLSNNSRVLPERPVGIQVETVNEAASSAENSQPAPQLTRSEMLAPKGEGAGIARENSRLIPLSAIQRNPKQPRKRFDQDKLNSLAEDIAENDVLQEITVRRLPPNVKPEHEGVLYQLVVGERRWRAAQLAGLSHIPAKVYDHLEDQEAALMAGAENLDREDLAPIEESDYYLYLTEEFGMKGAYIARRMGVSPSKVTFMLKIAKLRYHSDPELQQLFADFQAGQISYDNAYTRAVERERVLATDQDKPRLGRPSASINVLTPPSAAGNDAQGEVFSPLTKSFQGPADTREVARHNASGNEQLGTPLSSEREASRHGQSRSQPPSGTIKLFGQHMSAQQFIATLRQLDEATHTEEAEDFVGNTEVGLVKQMISLSESITQRLQRLADQ